jgi:hypothetical protein
MSLATSSSCAPFHFVAHVLCADSDVPHLAFQPRSYSSDMSKKKRQRAEAEAAAAAADPSGATDSRTEQEEEGGAPSAKRAKKKAKKSAAVAAAASSSAAAAAASVLPPDADDALRHFHRRCQQIRASDDLARVAVSSRDELGFRSQLDAAVDLLLADADRKDGPLIDLNYRVEGKGTLLMELIQQFARGIVESNACHCPQCLDEDILN